VETITCETLLLFGGTENVDAASDLGIGCLSIICSSVKDKAFFKKLYRLIKFDV
tara:strand:- start:259 stop:420 length:162 start_codon:yes stop_codon:yes gene_type:complete